MIKKARDLKPGDYLSGYGEVISVRVGWFEVKAVCAIEDSNRGHIRRFSKNEEVNILNLHDRLDKDWG